MKSQRAKKRWPGQHNFEMRIRVQGDGYRYRQSSYPRKIPDAVYHLEKWVKDPSTGAYENVVKKRKSKKRHPDLDPIPKLP